MFRAGLFLLTAALLAGALRGEELRPLDGYRTIMWIGESAYKQPGKFPLFLQRMRELGVNTGMIHRDGDPQPFVDAGFPFYLENVVAPGLCLKFSSSVRDWDKFVTDWKTERSEKALVRDYSLDDPAWRESQRRHVAATVRKFAPHRPILLDLRDELSVTISANPFDYDFSPTALAGFRAWLRTQYPDLAALNAGWHTDFASWDDVRPFTTDQIKNRMAGGLGPGPDGRGFPRGRPDWQAVQKITFDPATARQNPVAWNLAPWCDHRTYMDLSLARALDDFRQAARAADPGLPIGIEGTQMPAAFGGYDLWRLSQVLDWVEPYDLGNAREIFGSFMPGKPIFTTVGEHDPRAARRRLWHLLLEGDAGCIVWWSEDCIDWKKDDYPLTPRAQALAPVLKELQGPLATLFRKAKRQTDPIAIHYSQASVQVNWLLESTVDGSTWLRRFSSHEAAHNRMAQRRQAWVKLLQDAGYTPVFLSSEQIERGELEKFRVLVMSDSLALSDTEFAAIDNFMSIAKGTGRLLGSNDFGIFHASGQIRTAAGSGKMSLNSQHGHTQQTWSYSSLRWFGNELANAAVGTVRGGGGQVDLRDYLAERGGQLSENIARLIEGQASQLPPPAVRVPREACVRVHRYQLGGGGVASALRAEKAGGSGRSAHRADATAGGARLVAFERGIVWQMGEDLKQKGGNEALEKPIEFTATLAQPGHVYNLRTGAYAGRTDSIKVALDPWEPALYAITEEPVKGDVVAELSR